MTARTVTDVILGEAAFGRGRYDDMLAVASAIQNRSARLGVSPQDVVASRREFNAYGQPLPSGANAYREMAERAWNHVQTQGPVHGGTFYATPNKVGNLPKGLREVHTTAGHRYFEDPQNRAIGTALCYRQPSALTGAQRAIAVATSQPRNVPTPTAAMRSVPTPTFAQRDVPTLSSALARNPVSAPAVGAASAAPSGLVADAVRGGRVGPNTTNGVPTPSARPSQAAAVDPARFGGYAPTPDIASLRAPAVPTPTRNPMSIGSILGISPAAAATPTARPTLTARVPADGLVPSITPGAVASFSPRTPLQPSSVLSRAPLASSVPVPTAAPRLALPGSIPTPTTAPRSAVPTPKGRPQIASPRPAAPRQASAPQRAPAQVSRDPWSGLRQAASAPAQASARPQAPAVAPTTGPFGLSRGTVGRVAGAAIGSMVGGPVGGLLGGWLGGRIGNGMGAGGNAASGGAQERSAPSTGSYSRAGGFGGFAERDSVVGPDGGRVGGSSRSSSGGKSSGSSGSSGKSGGSSGSGGKSGGSSGSGSGGGGGKGGRK